VRYITKKNIERWSNKCYHLGSANSNADINVVSVYDVITIDDSIDDWLVLKCRNSGLPKKIGSAKSCTKYPVTG
jgi:hypothetical protein